MSLSPPVKITVPFATGGLKNAIPANANPTDGHAGYDVGFPAINMTPKTAGGIPPFGQDFNGIFFEVSTAIQFLEAGGSFPFDSAFATAVGGYPIGAIVSRTDSSGLWRNTVANNTTNPETFGAGWQPEDAGSSSVPMTNANVTLTALQSARSIIKITGVLTANLQLIFPTYEKQWIVANNATGAFSVTAKTVSGSGVIIPSGSTQCVYGDGTNINQSTFNTAARFIANGSFTVPTGVSTIYISGCAGGGGGGGGSDNSTGQSSLVGGGGGGGGGAGQFLYREPFSVTSGQVIAITIGSAGAAGAAGIGTAGGAGGTGGNTVIGSLSTLTGGGGGGGGLRPVANSLPNGGAGAAGGTGFPAGATGTDGNYSGNGGQGASAPYGGGGGSGRAATAVGLAGRPASGFGGGGGGGGAGYGSASAVNGGAGAVGSAGFVFIEC